MFKIFLILRRRLILIVTSLCNLKQPIFVLMHYQKHTQSNVLQNDIFIFD